ncbi:hypothetical protein LXL04_027946 [Taraxacum kok-saghyz]
MEGDTKGSAKGHDGSYRKDAHNNAQIQSFLAGVHFIVVGYRDDSGRLVRTERLRTKDMTHRVKMKNYWQVKTNNHLLKLPICPISLK